MIKKIFYDTIPIILIIAMFGYVLGVMYQIFEIPYIYKYTTTTNAEMWIFDIKSYLQNLQTSLNSLTKLELQTNPLSWQETTANILQQQFWQVLINNLAYMFNYLIFLINIILFIIRFAAYIFVCIFAILGMVRQPTIYNGQLFEPNWIMNIFVWISQNLQIPFIQP